MSKIQDDKYYTPIELANYCIDKCIEVIGLENIKDVIEPSCGNGSFFHHSVLKPSLGIDIKPEMSGAIVGDFLTYPLLYMRGRLIIGNPPFGNKLSLAQKFYKKAISVGDYIAFILPISLLNNNNFLYEFDLVYSEDLGKQLYSERNIHCCFNIYKRPELGVNNKKKITTDAITIYRQDCNDYVNKPFDIRMCYWGDGTVGKILTDDENYSGEYKIKINNELFRDKIYNLIVTFDWKNYLKCVAMKRLKQYHIVDVLLDNIPELTSTNLSVDELSIKTILW